MRSRTPTGAEQPDGKSPAGVPGGLFSWRQSVRGTFWVKRKPLCMLTQADLGWFSLQNLGRLTQGANTAFQPRGSEGKWPE